MFRKRPITPDPRRERIARHLRESGPAAGDELAAALGLAPAVFWSLINHPWFEITGKGWRLSARGRDEAAA